ncbi:unnamed protein product, partial [Laminaria digitata]
MDRVRATEGDTQGSGRVNRGHELWDSRRYNRFVGQQTAKRKSRVAGKRTTLQAWKFNRGTLICTPSIAAVVNILYKPRHEEDNDNMLLVLIAQASANLFSWTGRSVLLEGLWMKRRRGREW